MSLYGALYSGVSGLTAQSSAMGAISDNITNVSTIGFKNTSVNFQTLVTKQTSSTFYSAGGVQSNPRQAIDVQGLLQASTSQTDIAISGGGFFVVNEANTPTSSDAYFYTRAGSFKQDSEGFMTNAGGYYLQGWPTDAAGKIVPADSTLSSTNLNVISNDYLETINLSRVAGSAAATTEITIGANLPDTVAGTSFNTDVQFYDSLGTPRSLSFDYTKSSTVNQWNIGVTPPAGAAVLTSYDSAGVVHDSWGRLDFTSRPADGSIVAIDGVNYEFDSDGYYGGAVLQSETYNFTANTANSWTVGDVINFDVTLAGVAQTTLNISQSGAGITLSDMVDDIAAAITADTTLGALLTATSNGTGTLTLTSKVPDQEMTAEAFSVGTDNVTTGYLSAAPVNTLVTAFVTPTTQQVDTSTSTSIAGDVAQLVAKVIAYDTDFTSTNKRILQDADNTTTVLFHEDGTASIAVDATAALNSSGGGATSQTAAFTVDEVSDTYADYSQFVFAAKPVNNDTIIINGITYTFQSGEAINDGDKTISTAGTIGQMVEDLETAIETNDPYFPSGSAVRRRTNANSANTDNTLVLTSVSGKPYDVNMAGITTATNITDVDGTTNFGGTTVNVATTHSLVFDSKGLPADINVTSLKIQGFTNGASDMVGTTALAIDFGTVGGEDGMTQFGDEFTPSFITQNGSRFGSFAGVSISPEGTVTALFDNGDTRPIYQVPIATFVNPNGLESRTGNVWNASEGSGDYTLRTAGNGPAGVITQGSLEASTVDIGEEFTSMIVVQRAYSAATKIISTADQMLEELMRTKR